MTLSRFIFTLLFGLFFSLLLKAENEVEVMTDTLAEVTVAATPRSGALRQGRATAVTHVYMKRIEQEQRTTFKDLSALVPNLYVPDYGSKMTSSIYMRGLGARIDNPVMGIYIDGVGLANKNGFDSDMYDMRSVTVYRGPQGTLFGRNTIGGVIDVTTLSPLTYQGTRAAVGYGNGNTFDARLSHYHKFGQSFGIGIGGYYKHSDGFFKNHYEEDNPKNCDWSDEVGGRLRAEWQGNNGAKISNTLIYNWVNQGGFPYHFPNEQIRYNDFCGYRRSNIIEGINYAIPVGNYTLSGTTSYQFLSDQMDMDQDYTPMSYFTLTQLQKEHDVAQELALRPIKPIGSQGWNWITGLSLAYKHNALSAPVTFKHDGIDSLILKNANDGIATMFPDARIEIEERQFVIANDFMTHNANAAVYHTSYYTHKDWQFEAGLRLDFDYSHFIYNSNAKIHYLFTETMSDFRPLCSSLEGKEKLYYLELLPKLAVTYKGKGWSTYFAVSEGYKAGGFNTQLFSDILQNQMMEDLMNDLGVYFAQTSDYKVSDVITYKPEQCFNFELGASGRKTVGRVQLSGTATLFWVEILNQQLTVFPKKGTGRMMTNAGHSRSIGAELTATCSYRGLSANVNYGYTNARFVKFDNGHTDFSGKYVPYVPANTLSASVTYSLPFNHTFFRSLDFNVNVSAYGDIWWNEENSLKQPFYALLGANLALNMKGFSVEFWGKNLTNTKYNTFYFVSMGNAFLQSGKPITFGAKVAVNL